MNMALLQKILFGYSVGLAVVSAWVGVAYLMGREYHGVPTSFLWAAALTATVVAMPYSDPDWRRHIQEYILLVVTLLVLGASVVGLVLLTPFQWEDEAGSAMVDVVLAALLVAGLSILGRKYGRRPSP